MSEYPAHIEIEPHVHLVRGKNEARFPEANTLIIDDEILTLVDAGSHPEQVFSTLRDLGHKPEDLDRIVLTHFHADHKGYTSHFRRISNCEVLCHPLARDAVESFETMMKTIGIVSPETKEQWLSLLRSRLPHVQDDYIVDGTFRDDRPIDCGEVQLTPIHSPGHTHDHTCFGINGLEKILLVDIDLTDFGPWYGNIVSDLEDFRKSIERIIDLQPPMGISSHLLDPVTEGLDEQLRSYLAFFDKRDEEILHHIGEGVDTVKQLAQVPIIYPRIPYSVYLLFEEIMLDKHIEFLSKNDLVLLEDGHIQLQRA
ncbi:MAG: MBL fold metallo-hydrolase [Candidatus Thorarchaeota archaeon]|nr:MBL fold metallo-hydrolase [Candidatus Thorarchaeota archaeon]